MNSTEKVGRCHDCTAPQTEVNTLSRHILELQKDKGELTDRVRGLEAEVKEWKDKADLWCKTANLKDHNIMINKELEKENAELKSENQKWKDEWQEQVQKATNEGYARTLQTIQLSKAKEIMQKLIANAPDTYSGTNIELQQKKMFSFQDAVNKAEQFLKDSEE